MNSVQMHLALTHVPVILSMVGLIILVVAFLIKNPTLTTTSYVLILTAGIAAIPVFLTGEGTEEVVENLPGVSEAVIERHEEVAALAMISIGVAALMAAAALASVKWQFAPRVFRVATLFLALTSAGLMLQTAHLGGQVRHTEIRSGFALQSGDADAPATNEAGREEEPDND